MEYNRLVVRQFFLVKWNCPFRRFLGWNVVPLKPFSRRRGQFTLKAEKCHFELLESKTSSVVFHSFISAQISYIPQTTMFSLLGRARTRDYTKSRKT